MTERTSPEITIMRRSGGNTAPVLIVPITPESRRVFRLMTEDYIELRFSLADPVEFMIGDYVEDELFGRFTVTEKQSPAFNESAGAYSYSLRFDAYYMAWENRLFMLTTTASGARVRKETSWTLTGTLAAHAREVVNNLDVLGYLYGGSGFTVEIDSSTVSKAGQAIAITYDGTGIISAMNAMAEAFCTEWWVTGNVIHFGKCEHGDVMTFSQEDNMYAVSPQRNRETYANRVYFFGGTRNIPDTYGKTLSFTVTETVTRDGHVLFRDGTRPMTPDMLIRGGMEASGEFGAFSIGLSTPSRSDARVEVTRSGEFGIEVPRLNLAFAVRLVGEDLPGTVTFSYSLKYTLSGAGFTHTLWETERTVTDSGSGTDDAGRVTRVETTVPALSEQHYLIPGDFTLSLEISPIRSDGTSAQCFIDSASLPEGAACRFVCRATSAGCRLTYEGNGYDVSFNPFHAGPVTEDFSFFTFTDGGSFAGPPEGFGPGSSYTLGFSDGKSDGVDITKVPLSFWSSEYQDPSSLMKIGENRLRLPASRPGGYIDSPSADGGERTVEKAVVLDHIYPRCVLTVTGVTETRRKDTEENADGTDTHWNWTQYTLTASLMDGSPFPFRRNHVKAGVTLQARFLTPEDAGITAADAPCRLAGMTFDVLLGTDGEGNPAYTLKRNTDYGAKLPNETLRPAEGDPFVLIGWDVEALPSLGLLEAAERELEAAAEEYMAALEEDRFVFRCTMFPDSMRSLDALPAPGRRVKVVFAGREKTSRVLGFAMKLDMPWDSPEYEVGETEAYSRLRALESRISGGGAAAGGTVTEDGGSGQGQDLSGYLTAEEAAGTYATKDEAAQWSDPDTATEAGLTAGGVTKTLLKSSAIDYPQKVVGIMTEDEYLGALDAFFPNRQ